MRYALQRADMERLWQLGESGNPAAREELARRFAPLARKVALRYVASSEPFDDLLQVANLGLITAINRFDPDRGNSFASFAVPTILGELKRYFRNTGGRCTSPVGPRSLRSRFGLPRAR
jgi:RNA polymerase sigma factor (sigma-70 family)